MVSTVTAATVFQEFWHLSGRCGARAVIITKNGRPRTVLIAYEDYVRLAARDRRVELTSQLSDADIAAVEGAEMEQGLDHLNAELDDKTITGAHAAG